MSRPGACTVGGTHLLPDGGERAARELRRRSSAWGTGRWRRGGDVEVSKDRRRRPGSEAATNWGISTLPAQRPATHSTCHQERGHGGFEARKEVAYGQEPRHGRYDAGGPAVVHWDKKRKNSRSCEGSNRRRRRRLIGRDAEVMTQEESRDSTRDGPPCACVACRDIVCGVVADRGERRALFG